jgi:hypothetical protein
MVANIFLWSLVWTFFCRRLGQLARGQVYIYAGTTIYDANLKGQVHRGTRASDMLTMKDEQPLVMFLTRSGLCMIG